MEVNTFRDVIAAEVGRYNHVDPPSVADDVLATPEMQAIKSALRSVAVTDLMTHPKTGVAERKMLELYDLPEHIIDWVLS